MDSAAVWTLATLLIGIVVVVGGILVLRLHAFLALSLAALTVAFLTPRSMVENFGIDSASYPVTVMALQSGATDADSDTAPELAGHAVSLSRPKELKLADGAAYVLLARESDADGAVAYRVVAYLHNLRFGNVASTDSSPQQQPPLIAGLSWPKSADSQTAADLMDRQFRLIESSAYRAAVNGAKKNVAERVASGFGSTAGKIGLLIAMASIIGKCLLDSGAADRVVRTTLGWFGEKFAPASFVISGFLLGVPVFFDTVFYLMIPLGKAMQVRTGRNYLLYVLTIVAGATMAHSLVPPTPGPLVVAEELGVSIGMMMLGGTIVGLFTAGFGYVYAVFANRFSELPLRESPDFTRADLDALASRDESELPPFWLSLLPIILPVILISGDSVIETLKDANLITLSPGVAAVVSTLGDKNVALIIAAIVAMLTLVRSRRLTRRQLADAVGSSLSSGGVIILITSAGGAFGGILQDTGVSTLITSLPLGSPAIVVSLAWLITAAIRTAQGSATVAMMTAVGILSGLAQSGGLGFHPVYLALAIGCGSKPVAWMNDSGFWVITRMSGMTEAEGLKYVTPMTSLMGVVGLVVVIIGVTLFPMG